MSRLTDAINTRRPNFVDCLDAPWYVHFTRPPMFRLHAVGAQHRASRRH
jgi:hypothetical protein